MAALLELLALIALVVTIIAGLLQISDWLNKRNRKPVGE
jgi:hypothetical protein